MLKNHLAVRMAAGILINLWVFILPAASHDLADEALDLAKRADALSKEGRYAEAGSLLEQAIAMWQSTFGTASPIIGLATNRLGVIYEAQGRDPDAEALYKRAITILESAEGANSPTIAPSLDNLAKLYLNRGRYAEAEPLLKRGVSILETVSEPEHLATLENDLAELYREQARYPEAEPLFKRALAIEEKVLSPNDPDLGTTLNNLASLYIFQGQYAEAEPLLKRALVVYENGLSAKDPLFVKAVNNLGELYRQQGRYAEAEPLFKRALTTPGLPDRDVARSLNNLGLLYRDQGRYRQAVPLLERAVKLYESSLGTNHRDFATCLNNLAVLYQMEGRLGESERALKQALAVRENALGPKHPEVATSLNNLAAFYKDLGRYDAAEPLYKQALEISENALGPDHPDVATSVRNLALLYQSQGRYADVEPLLQRALAIRERAFGEDHPAVARSLIELADIDRAQGFLVSALAISTRAVRILERHFATETGQRSGAAFDERRMYREYFLAGIAIAYAAQGKASDEDSTTVTESFTTGQFARASIVAASIAGMSARFAAGDDALAAIIRQREQRATQWQQLDEEIAKAASRLPADRKPEQEASLRSEIDETEHELSALDGRIAREFPAYAELANPPPVPAEAARSLVGADEALMVFLVAGDEAWLWVVRHDGIKFLRLDIAAKALAAEIKELRSRLDPRLNPNSQQQFEATRAHALYEKIFAPALPVLAGVHHLLIVPDGPLESLPFAVLVSKPPKGDPEDVEDNRAVAWLARDYAITILPSVSSLRALRQLPHNAAATAPFLGIGDPLLQGHGEQDVTLSTLFRGATADVEKVRDLPPLPETADELRAIAKLLGASDGDLLLGARASEPVLRQMPLDHYRVIDFATHGLTSGELRGLAEPALVLTPPAEATGDNDGLLTASKIATLKLDAEWVVLSACNTAAGDGTPDAEGLSGLAKAFFYAGARSLLVSHWPVQSDAAVKLTTGAFAELTKDPTIGRAEALRRAELKMLDPGNPPEFSHPLLWAPFVLVGEGGEGR